MRWNRLAALLAVSASLGISAVSPEPLPAQEERRWEEQSIYMIVTDRFHNGDPSRDLDRVPGKLSWWQGGDLRGVIDKLDAISALGMTAIWITPPLAQTPGGYHGYWTLDHYQIDPHLGDMATLQELVQKAHDRGLKVILDVVLNHVGYGHPWLTDPARKEWFHERVAVSWYSQQGIEDGWLFDLPDLDTENLEVRSYLIDWSLWLMRETGVDGFRLDTVRHMPLSFVREWVTALKQVRPDFWILGEVFSSDYQYQARYLSAGLDAVTDFGTQEAIAKGLGGSKINLDLLTYPPALAANLLPSSARATFIDNHDLPRFVGFHGSEEAQSRLKLALAYLYTMPGIPVLYYGTEVALPGGRDPDNRRPMEWDALFNPDLRTFTAQVAALRQQRVELRRGQWVELTSSAALLVYARVLGDLVTLVAFNGDSRVPVDVAVDLQGLGVKSGTRFQGALQTDSGSFGTIQVRNATLQIMVPPGSARIWVTAARSAPSAWTYSGGAALGLALGGAAIRLIRRRR